MPRPRRVLTCLSLVSAAALACGPTEPTKPAPAAAPASAAAPAPGATKAPPTPPEAVKTPPVAAEPEAMPPPPLDPQVAASVADSINGFAIDLHRALADRPGNLFVSPASIAVAFAMTHAGARGETEREIAKVFHFGGDAAKTRESFAGALAGWSAPQEGRELVVANRLFGEKTLGFEPAFLEITRTDFAAPLEPADFKTAAEPARERINAWVAERTRDKIKDLLPPRSLDELTRLVLVNAVYFKADWQTAFTVAATRPADFHGGAGKKSVPMMSRTGELAAHVAPGLKVLELPYKGGFSFVVVLPDAKDGLAAIEKRLDAATLRGWISGLRPQEVAVQLPRFKMEPGESLPLAKTLRALGMPSAFDKDKADFTGVAPRPEELSLADAYHKAFLAVDEVGTEAAAATAVVMTARGAAMPKAEPLAFTADHPFLFMIRDQKTGAILFMGRLVDP